MGYQNNIVHFTLFNKLQVMHKFLQYITIYKKILNFFYIKISIHIEIKFL